MSTWLINVNVHTMVCKFDIFAWKKIISDFYAKHYAALLKILADRFSFTAMKVKYKI